MVTPPRDRLLGTPASSHAVLVGAAGSGKTALLIDRLVDVVGQGVRADDVLMLTPQRSQASELRDRVQLALGRATAGPRARSIASFAFALVDEAHRERGLPKPDVLSASQIDADIEALLEGHIEDGGGPLWPEPLVEEVRRSVAFRGELREFMARLIDHHVSSGELRRVAQDAERPEWTAVADFFDEFERVISSGRPGAFDSAGIIQRARVVAEEGLPSSLARLSHLCVDNAHDLTNAGLDLLKALGQRGIGVTLAVDPDSASNTFRGANPRAVSEIAATWGVSPLEMPLIHRYGEPLKSLVAEVTGRIGTAGFGPQRRAQSREDVSTELVTLVAPSAQREVRDIARLITKAHVEDGIAWEQIAVLARRGSHVSDLVRELGVSGIPARASVAGMPLREQRAAKELLELVAVGRGLLPLTPSRALSLLTGRYGHLSPQDIRRLRFGLRIQQDPHAPYTSSEALIVEELSHRGGFSTLETKAATGAHLMAVLLDDLKSLPAHQPITEALWMVVERTGVLPRWVRQAAEPGVAQAGAHRALDSVLAVFASAEDYVDAYPGASMEVFLESVLNSSVPEDVVMREPAWPAVTVATPARVAGREFDLVVIAGVNDQVWPDLRLRDSLLRAPIAIQLARGVDVRGQDERRSVLEDELRLFALSLTRARRRVVVTTVESEENAPSALFRLASGFSSEEQSQAAPAPTLRSVVARLRGSLVAEIGNPLLASQRASDLALAASEGAAGAHPDSWWGVREASSTDPLYPEGEVPISPSAIQALEESPIEWFLDHIAQGESTSERGLGLLIHRALEECPSGSSDELWDIVDSQFGQLDYEAGWIEQYHRRLAKGMVDALAEYLEDRARQGATMLASEVPFHIRHGRAVVNGVIDRLEQSPDGRLLVVDLKTGSPRTDSQVADDPQMLAYQLGVATPELKERVGLTSADREGAALLFVKSGVRGKRYRIAFQQPPDDLMTKSMLTRIDRACELIAAHEFRGEPRSFGVPGAPSRHRWHFVGQVCGDD